MHNETIHRTITSDGTEIAARVHGSGPPVVLVHGALESGDTCWEALLPFLREHFSCYAMSRRGRGLSGYHADLSLERQAMDIAEFIESIGGPVGLVGESGGGEMALGAAARTDCVAAIAVYEPALPEVEALFTGLESINATVAAKAAAGDPAGAVRAFGAWVGNDEERGILAGSDDIVEALIPNLEVQIEEFRQVLDTGKPGASRPSPTTPAALSNIEAPILVLKGAESGIKQWIDEAVGLIEDCVGDTAVCEIDGAGHWGPSMYPEPIADEIVQFMEPRLKAASA